MWLNALRVVRPRQAAARATRPLRRRRFPAGPPGRLRPIVDPPVTGLTRAWAGLLLRTTFDPDGRPALMKLRREGW